jgi:hypothetical protein
VLHDDGLKLASSAAYRESACTACCMVSPENGAHLAALRRQSLLGRQLELQGVAVEHAALQLLQHGVRRVAAVKLSKRKALRHLLAVGALAHDHAHRAQRAAACGRALVDKEAQRVLRRAERNVLDVQ